MNESEQKGRVRVCNKRAFMQAFKKDQNLVRLH